MIWDIYCISPYKTRWYYFLFHFHSKVTVPKCAGIIRKRVLFEGGPYMRKYGIQATYTYQNDCNAIKN